MDFAEVMSVLKAFFEAVVKIVAALFDGKTIAEVVSDLQK